MIEETQNKQNIEGLEGLTIDPSINKSGLQNSPVYRTESSEICGDYIIQKDFYSDGSGVSRSINIKTNRVIKEHRYPPILRY